MLNKRINSDNIDLSNINNLSHEFFQINQNFDKMNIKEIEPTTKNINKNIFEEDLTIVIDELVNHIFKEINEGKDKDQTKKYILNYIDDNNMISQEIYNWLLNTQNDSNSIYLLGYFNYHGIGTDINEQKAIEIYKKAINFGSKLSYYDLANIYMESNIENNYEKAFELSKKLAEKGYASGIHILGHCYNWGIGTNIDTQKAFKLFQEAANLGNLNGMGNLANYYYFGIKTNIDKQKAFELYRKAANLGHHVAQYNLALIYENGDVINKDMDQAIYWYKKSAEQGYKYAQVKLEEFSNENVV
ncbi:uncharacterized protein OCT59_023650 [Rhizophagus irregularis]|uniref:Skt5p n=2 Tax=Rhizophagus irregularis TaxID=588596 RepID=A0A015NA14_RHIIW|nr:Skt5p [Rhizophagus irregularis DAOM 197198w]UZO03242.1 hypothetical protein OCT59_023650 [Rhizophagus irregularis]